MLTDEDTNTDTRHVEAIEKALHVGLNVLAPSCTLVLEHALGHSSYDGVMPCLDLLETPSEALIVVVDLWGPILDASMIGVISAEQ